MDYETLVTTFGPVAALLIVAILSGWRGYWVWGRDVAACEARMEKMRLDYEHRLEAQRAAHVAREAELAATTDRWQRLFFEMLGPIAGAVEVVAARTGNGGKPP